MKRDIAKIEKQIDRLLDRIVEASLPSVVSAYEKRLAKLETEKTGGTRKIGKRHPAQAWLRRIVRTRLPISRKPLGTQGIRPPDPAQNSPQTGLYRPHFLRPKTGLRIPETTLPFKVLGRVSGRKCLMAERQGFEPWVGLHPQRFSRPPRSTTPAPLRGLGQGSKPGPWRTGSRKCCGTQGAVGAKYRGKCAPGPSATRKKALTSASARSRAMDI